MPCQLLRAKPIADDILAGFSPEARRLADRGTPAGLAVVLVGGDALARNYFERKRRACAQLGLHAAMVELPVGTSTAHVISELRTLGNDQAIHSILLQYPLPSPIDLDQVAAAIPVEKDVDGMRPASDCLPCAIEGGRLLLQAYHVSIAGQPAIVVGNQPGLAEPLVRMLRAAGAIVSRCDADEPNLVDRIAAAQIVATAIGRAQFVRGEWLQPGAVVIDTGLNAAGDQVVGDVDLPSAVLRAGYLTPVPGGLGTMTMAVLVQRTVTAAGSAQSGA